MAKWINNEAIDVLSEYYYPRAAWLQENCNWGKLSYESEEATKAVNDDLMQKIDIYDCSTRNAAGFSNVIQDLWYKENTPKRHHQNKFRKEIISKYQTESWDRKTWFYAMLAHRTFGSGASFENDHGYRNNAVQYWGELRDIQDFIEDIQDRKAHKVPMFTSIGNQPPSPRKGTSCIDYLIKEVPNLLDQFIDWSERGERKTHKQIVDFLNEYNITQGHRRFNFVYAAFSYDMGDYFQDITDPDSHGYFGNNAVRCMKKMSGGYSTDEFMDILVERTGGAPRDLEDVMCDFIRFGQNYVPRGNGTFDHIPSNIQNNSGWVSGWEQRQGKPPERGIDLLDFV